MKIATLIAGLGLGALVLSGCGGSSNPSNPSEQSEDQKKFIGTWHSADPSGCRSFHPGSSKVTLKVTENQMILTRKKYDADNCKDSNLTLHTITTSNYKIGEDTVFSDDTSAKELDLKIKDFRKIKGTAEKPKDLYTMFTFISHDDEPGCPKGKSCLLIAPSNSHRPEHDGSTPAKRANKKDDGFIKD